MRYDRGAMCQQVIANCTRHIANSNAAARILYEPITDRRTRHIKEESSKRDDLRAGGAQGLLLLLGWKRQHLCRVHRQEQTGCESAIGSP